MPGHLGPMAAISCHRGQKRGKDSPSPEREGRSSTDPGPGLPFPCAPGAGNWSDFFLLRDVFVHIHPATRGTTVMELRKERVPAEPLLMHQGGKKRKQKENPRTTHARAQQGSGGSWQGNSGFVPGGKQPQAHGDPQSCHGCSPGSSATAPGGHWDTLVTHKASPMSGHLTPAESLWLSREAWPFILPPRGCCAHPQPPCSSSPPSRQAGAASPAVPRGSGLSGTSKAPQGAGGAAGGWRWLRGQLDPNPSSEG